MALGNNIFLTTCLLYICGCSDGSFVGSTQAADGLPPASKGPSDRSSDSDVSTARNKDQPDTATNLKKIKSKSKKGTINNVAKPKTEVDLSQKTGVPGGSSSSDFDSRAGTPVTTLAVFFEDGQLNGNLSDNDYNDAVVCFKGDMKVNQITKEIFAYRDRRAKAIFSRLSHCTNVISVWKVYPEGSGVRDELIAEFKSDINGRSEVDFSFPENGRIKVTMAAGLGCNYSKYNPLSMWNSRYALLKSGVSIVLHNKGLLWCR